MEEFKKNIGKKVKKRRIGNPDRNSKPFKSGFKINTIKDVIEHPIRKEPAYTFEEDDSYVSCVQCILVD